METQNILIEKTKKAEVGVEELRAQRMQIEQDIADVETKLDPLTDELKFIPEVREIARLIKKNDSVRDNKEFDKNNKEIDRLYASVPGLVEKMSEERKLKEKKSSLTTQLYELAEKIRKCEILESKKIFLDTVLVPLIFVVENGINQNEAIIGKYEFQVKSLVDEAGMKLADAFGTLPQKEQIHIGQVQDKNHDLYSVLEELQEVQEEINRIEGIERYAGDSIGQAQQRVERIKKKIAGKQLL